MGNFALFKAKEGNQRRFSAVLEFEDRLRNRSAKTHHADTPNFAK